MASGRARGLRARSTDAERRMWNALRNRVLAGGEVPAPGTIGPYYADFLCHEARLVVEIDGGQHIGRDETTRDARFAQAGFRIVRFWSNDVMRNLEGVLTALRRTLLETPHPPGPVGPGPSLSHKGRGDAQ
ncbi:MAG: endonuclease domain-containing protein [Alphaproteobacteria bacterium]|nr:endonuclease domain-containing protein [Alphaproteobacteria bacterium]